MDWHNNNTENMKLHGAADTKSTVTDGATVIVLRKAGSLTLGVVIPYAGGQCVRLKGRDGRVNMAAGSKCRVSFVGRESFAIFIDAAATPPCDSRGQLVFGNSSTSDEPTPLFLLLPKR